MFRAKQRVCPDVYHAAGIKWPLILARASSPRIQQCGTRTCFLNGRRLSKCANRPSPDHLPMSSASWSLCSLSSENSSFAVRKFERRSLLSSFSSENFRSLIISTKYDCARRVEAQPDNTASAWNIPGIPRNHLEFPQSSLRVSTRKAISDITP